MKALNVNKLTKCGVTFKFWYVWPIINSSVQEDCQNRDLK